MVSLGYHKVFLEMDCKMVVDDVNNMKANDSEYDSIIQDCKTLVSNYNDFIVVFIRRQASGNAHTLAKTALSHVSRNIFLYNF
jgi:hypothetical protein